MQTWNEKQSVIHPDSYCNMPSIASLVPASVPLPPTALIPSSLVSSENTDAASNAAATTPQPESHAPADYKRFSLGAAEKKWYTLHKNFTNSRGDIMTTARRVADAVLKEAGVQVANAAVSGLAVWLVHQLSHSIPGSTPQQHADNANALGNAPPVAGGGNAATRSADNSSALLNSVALMIVPTVSNLIPALVRAFQRARAETGNVEIKILQHIHKALQEEEAEYLQNEKVPPANKKALQKLHTELEKLFAADSTQSGSNTMKSNIDAIKGRLEQYLWLRAIPLHAKNISHMEKDDDIEARRRIDQNVKELIMGLNPELHEPLESFINSVRENSVKAMNGGGSSSLLYLYGSGGTGKTRVVNQVAKALEMPYVKIMTKEKRLSQVFGEERCFPAGDTTILEDKRPVPEQIGDFTAQWIRSGYTNMVIHLEELGDDLDDAAAASQIVTDLKERLDREYHTISSLGNALIPMNLVLIVTSNKRVTADVLPPGSTESLKALMSRMTYIEMPPISREIRNEVAEKRWTKAIDGLKNKYNDYRPVVALKDTILTMVLEEEEAREIPGVRILERVIDRVVADVFYRKYKGIYDRASTGNPITEDDIREMIKKRYDESILDEGGNGKARPAPVNFLSWPGDSPRQLAADDLLRRRSTSFMQAVQTTADKAVQTGNDEGEKAVQTENDEGEKVDQPDVSKDIAPPSQRKKLTRFFLNLGSNSRK